MTNKHVVKYKEPIPFEEIITDLNEVTGRIKPQSMFTACKSTKKLIRPRWEELVGMDDEIRFKCFQWVHRIKAMEWFNDPKMAKYLRPSTLYAPSHFHEYRLQQPEGRAASKREQTDDAAVREFLEGSG